MAKRDEFARILDFSLAQSGRQFNDLTALEVVAFNKNNVKYRVRCKCGNEIDVWISNLFTGNTKRCPRCHVHASIKHNLSRTLFYKRVGWLRNDGKMAAEWGKFENLLAWVKSVAPDVDLTSPHLFLRRFDDNQPYSPNNSYLVLKDASGRIVREYNAPDMGTGTQTAA